jgi:hypothetical protein
MCPGYVNTDMTAGRGNLTVDEGADTAIWLATLPEGATSPAGEFCYDRKIGEW